MQNSSMKNRYIFFICDICFNLYGICGCLCLMTSLRLIIIFYILHVTLEKTIPVSSFVTVFNGSDVNH